VILLVGVILGLIAGYGRAWLAKRPYALPAIQRVELALLAFLPQGLIFFVPQTGRLVSQQWAAFILPISLGILVLFVWYNRRRAGFWLLGVGLLLNLAVIVANGGLMPISPETWASLHGNQVEAPINSHVFGSKSIVMPVEETRLEWLGDRFIVPDQLPIKIAFSLGDVFLVIGAFWMLWVGGAVRHHVPGIRLERQSYLSQSYEES
jgi:hypothetical protein